MTSSCSHCKEKIHGSDSSRTNQGSMRRIRNFQPGRRGGGRPHLLWPGFPPAPGTGILRDRRIRHQRSQGKYERAYRHGTGPGSFQRRFTGQTQRKYGSRACPLLYNRSRHAEQCTAPCIELYQGYSGAGA